MRGRSAVEGDGVLQMLVWLGRTPESFVARVEPRLDDALPVVGPERIVRFDTAAIHLALEAQRGILGLTWPQVARATGGVTAASLTRLARGGRTSFPQVMRIVRWLDRPAAAFTRASQG